MKRHWSSTVEAFADVRYEQCFKALADLRHYPYLFDAVASVDPIETTAERITCAWVMEHGRVIPLRYLVLADDRAGASARTVNVSVFLRERLAFQTDWKITRLRRRSHIELTASATLQHSVLVGLVARFATPREFTNANRRLLNQLITKDLSDEALRGERRSWISDDYD